MKWICSIVVFVFYTFIAPAQDCGRVVISNGTAQLPRFVVSLNGVRPAGDYAASISFNCLDENSYRVKILQENSMAALVFQIGSAPGYLSKYILNYTNGNYALVLESKVLLSSLPQAPVASPTLVSSPSGTVLVLQGHQVMNDEDYDGIMQAIKKENFESGKLELAKTFFGVPGQYVSVNQVAGVLKLFSFENHRLAFAKFAYTYTLNRLGYYKLFDLLSFNSSKKELSDYINSKNPE